MGKDLSIFFIYISKSISIFIKFSKLKYSFVNFLNSPKDNKTSLILQFEFSLISNSLAIKYSSLSKKENKEEEG